MDIHAIFTEVKARHTQNAGHAKMWLNADDITRWANHSVDVETELFNALGAELALAFHNGELTFDQCDDIANVIWHVLCIRLCTRFTKVIPDSYWPMLFHNVYLAFDAGEFPLTKDRTDDPVADHTVP
jgi:hypothetical protein